MPLVFSDVSVLIHCQCQKTGPEKLSGSQWGPMCCIGYKIFKGGKGLWSRAMLMSSFWQHPQEFKAIYSQSMFANYSKCTFPGNCSRQFEFVVFPISKDRNSMFWGRGKILKIRELDIGSFALKPTIWVGAMPLYSQWKLPNKFFIFSTTMSTFTFGSHFPGGVLPWHLQVAFRIKSSTLLPWLYCSELRGITRPLLFLGVHFGALTG